MLLNAIFGGAKIGKKFAFLLKKYSNGFVLSF